MSGHWRRISDSLCDNYVYRKCTAYMVRNPDDYGEPAPREPFFKGPVNKRSCTDIICCTIFVATVVGYMTIGVLAWLLGDPRHVLFPRNSAGMFCGVGVNVCHGGSVALGAVVLSVFQAPRIFLEYLYHRFRDCQNPCSQSVMISLKCCFWFLDKFLKFFHRNTYIMIAIYGNSFSVSAKKAYTLLKRNVGRVVEMDSVTDTFLLSNKVLVVGLVGLLVFFFFSGRIRLPDDTFQVQLLHYDWLPTITVMVGAYFVTQGFFSVYSMCTDTLFLCFLEDLERNNGTMQRPYHMSRTLWQILYKP